MSREMSAADLSSFLVVEEEAKKRLDVVLVAHFPQFSRTQLRRAIVAGDVMIDGESGKPNFRVAVGQRVTLVALPPSPPGPEPEDIPLDVVYEDDDLAAINKAAGMVVHPSKGHWSGTLVAGLAFHLESLSTLGGETRPGIVHRLDRDTTGIIIVAKNDTAHKQLAGQFESRAVKKEYLAIVRGEPDRDADVIDQPIGVHPYHREKMAIRTRLATAREAVTRYEVASRFSGFAAIHVFPRTGRTHQIRVHLTHIGCPVLCDRLYAGHAKITRGELTGQRGDMEILLERQALHARRISIVHPSSGEPMSFEAPLPDDLIAVMDALRGRA